jgi:hypothetical protein
VPGFPGAEGDFHLPATSTSSRIELPVAGHAIRYKRQQKGETMRRKETETPEREVNGTLWLDQADLLQDGEPCMR